MDSGQGPGVEREIAWRMTFAQRGARILGEDHVEKAIKGGMSCEENPLCNGGRGHDIE
jgi:hypothetical protein